MGGFELWMWLFMRISGIVLLVLALGHTVDHAPAGRRGGPRRLRIRRRSLGKPVLAHVGLDDADPRAGAQGINGLKNITLDYVRKPGVRFASNMGFYVLGFTLFILGTVIIVTFDPSDWPPVA